MHTTTLLVGGIPLTIFSHQEKGTKPVVILFLLHGRTQKSQDYHPFVTRVFDEINEDKIKRSLYIVTFVSHTQARIARS
jgi:hypothetical protein